MKSLGYSNTREMGACMVDSYDRHVHTGIIPYTINYAHTGTIPQTIKLPRKMCETWRGFDVCTADSLLYYGKRRSNGKERLS